MPYCIKCGKELAPGAKFCFECGAPVEDNKKDAQSDNLNQRKSVFEGEIHKCPNCGELIQAFVYKCPSCGHEFRGATNSKALKEFAEKLEYASSVYDKASIIRNYPIPNTKEDIYEFLILASSNIGNLESDELTDAWTVKTEQAMEKARIVFSDKTEYEQIQEVYKHVADKLVKVKRTRAAKNTQREISGVANALPGSIAAFGWFLSLFIILPLCRVNVDNVGTNGFQLLFIVDVIAGTVFIPHTFKNGTILPKLVTSAGLILSILVLLPLCSKHLDNVGTNAFQLLLIIEIICCIIIFVKMFKSRSVPDSEEKSSTRLSLRITIICIIIWLIVYGIGYFIHPYSEKNSGSSSDSSYTYKDEDELETIVWDDLLLGDNLPAFSYDQAEVIWDTENVLTLYFYDMNNTIYKSYIEECQEFGYTIDADNSGANYTAYNSDGYYLHLQYLDFADDKLTIDLEDPIKENPITWPENDLVKKLPVPEKLIGEVSTENSSAYAVYLTGMEPDYFDTYVSECQKAGFNIDYSKSDDYFSAEHKDGRELTVEYKGFNILYIYVSDYDW